MHNISLRDIRSLNQDELKDLLLEYQEPPYRAKQIYEWLWHKSAKNFEEMTSLPKELRYKLHENFRIYSQELADIQQSSDKTIKAALRLHDGNLIESVLIPTEDRITACVSSQVGCSLSCAFCATGKLSRKRNLSPGEIYDQVVWVKNLAEEKFLRPLTNIVFMGMGEPLLNYANVMEAIEKITSPNGLGMSPSRITLSTAGVAKMIRKLADDQVKFNLALSLHAADDEKRNKMMAINETNNLSALKEALQYFYLKTKNKITLEYIIFKNINDDVSDALNLIKFALNLPCKINIIEYNPIGDGIFKQADEKKVQEFIQVLRKNKLIVNIRKSRGKDIDAACGQLANKNNIKVA